MVVLTDGKEGRNEYCQAMALYCPLPGQFLAIARQETTRREEGEATRLLSLLPFTLHQTA